MGLNRALRRWHRPDRYPARAGASPPPPPPPPPPGRGGGEGRGRRAGREKPLIYLYGRAKERAERIGMRALDVSLTHELDFAVAAVVGVREGEVEDPQESRERLVRRLKERGLL